VSRGWVYGRLVGEEPSEQLPGGNMGSVLRVGDTVVRAAGEWTPAVHRLLRRLEAVGVSGVPRPIGFDERREVLSFVEGVVPSYPMPSWVWTGVALDTAAQLLRRIHDATVELGVDGPWRGPGHEPVEVICHNDFAPYNLVFAGTTGRVVGAIDWDFASPGPRLWDVSYLAYRIVPLSTAHWGDRFSEEERRQRLSRLLAAYGTGVDARRVIDALRERLKELAALSDELAEGVDKPELHDHADLYRYDAAHLPQV
jgi:hypothetical protein